MWPLPVAFVTGPAFKHSQLAAVIAAADATYPQYRFSPGQEVKVVYTAAESAALDSTWTNYPVSE
jgi:hypothetical protein